MVLKEAGNCAMTDENGSHLPEAPEDWADRDLQAVLDAMPIPVTWARLEDARIIFMNRKFTEVFGYQVGDFETVPEWVEKAYPDPHHRARAEGTWYMFFGNPTLHEYEIDPVEVDVLCRDGTIKTTILGGVIVPKAGLAVATFVDISDRKRDEVLVRQLAEEDPLTGLRNRRAFDAHLEYSMKQTSVHGSSLNLLILDLDLFKEVNDRFGHALGDVLLQEVATRISDSVRSSDVVARFGGDEFGVILTNTAGQTDVGRVCDKLIAAVEEPVEIEGHTIHPGVSIGVGCCPQDASSPGALFRAADQALYQAKQQGRGSWSYGPGRPDNT